MPAALGALRVTTPCSENLDAMPRNADGGVHCTACDRDVLDLRRTPTKRALRLIEEARAQGDGKVCVRVRARAGNVPVFAKDPSALSRFALPAVLAGSLAACAPGAGTDRGTTPIAMVPTTQEAQPTNANGTTVRTPVVTPAATVHAPPQQPGTMPIYEVAGGLG